MSEEETPKEILPVLIVKSAQDGSGVIAALHAKGEENGRTLYEMKTEPLPKLDWGQLKVEVEKSGLIRAATLTATMPKEEPLRILDGQTNGIPPVREWMSNGPYLPRQEKISEDQFRRRLALASTYGTMHYALEAAVGGNQEARQLLDQIAAPGYIHYDPVTGMCSLVDSPEDATGQFVEGVIETFRKTYDGFKDERAAAKQRYFATIDSMSQHPDVAQERRAGDRLMVGVPRYSNTNYVTMMEPTRIPFTTTTQMKKQKREAKKPTKAGQNYLKIGKR